MTGKQQLAEVIRRVTPITNRLVDHLDACPHEAAMLGYLLGLRRGALYELECKSSERPITRGLVEAIEDFIVRVTRYGLPG